LAVAARGLGALPDQPLTATEFVEHVVAILDEWVAGHGAAHEDETNPPADRETIRAWAKEQGIEVADVGRLSKAVEDAYRAAHGG
jgi:hypothetical protein